MNTEPTLTDATRVWARIGLLSFGGPAAQIALMHRELVEERGWLTERQYLDALSFCMLLPGPEAMQLATYSGWRLHGVRGGLIAGLMFVLPGAVVIAVLAALYVSFGTVALAQAVFLGVKAAVLIIVIEALLRVAGRALQSVDHWLIAGAAFVMIFFLALPYPLVIALAAFYGALKGGDAAADDMPHAAIGVSSGHTLKTILIWLAIWLTPVALLWNAGVFGDLARFFSVLATVTFGGAYAVLAFMAQEAVENYAWLSAGEMLDSLGLAETTPGPLILVTQFVGFLAAARSEGDIDLWRGLLGAMVTLWVTFVPCFLWIFAGAPYIDWIGTRPRLRSALSAITAAVVGVILSLSLWFALHVLFGSVTRETIGPLALWTPDIITFDWRVLVIALVAAILILRLHVSLLLTLAICAAMGVAVSVFA